MGVGVPAAEAVDTQMTINTTDVIFGLINVGNTSSPMSVTLTNSGSDSFGPINIFGGAPVTLEFSASQNCAAVTLRPGGSCSVNYRFSPTAPGLFNDLSEFTISETANEIDGEVFAVSLTGVGINPISAAPSRHDFGSVIVGTTSPAMTTVFTNSSDENFGPISTFGGGPPTEVFRATENCRGTTLLPGGTCQIDYTFSPPAPGVFDYVSPITISATPSQAAGIEFRIELTGCGAVVQCPLPNVTLDPGSLSVTLAPDQSTVAAFAIGNVGAAPLNWTIAENNASAGPCVTLDVPWAGALRAGGSTEPGDASNVNVTFDSTGLAPGTYLARLCVDSNDPDEQQLTVALTLTVISQSVTRVIPVVGSTAGAFDSFFRTGVQLYNPSESPLVGTFVYHPAGIVGSPADPSFDFTIPPESVLSYADLVEAMGLSGLGSIDIVLPAGDVPVVVARVFDDAGAAGTTGFTEELVDPNHAPVLFAVSTSVLIAPADAARFRFNIGVRTFSSGASLTIRVLTPTGSLVRSVSKTFDLTYFIQQRADVFLEGPIGPNDIIEISVSQGSAVVYGATTDNTTNDPSMQFPRKVDKD